MALGAGRARLARQMITESLRPGARRRRARDRRLRVDARTARAARAGGHPATRPGAHRRTCGRVHLPDRSGRRPALRHRAGVPGACAPPARRAARVGPRPGVRLQPAGAPGPRRRGDRVVADAARRRRAARPEFRATAAGGYRVQRIVRPDRRSDRAAARAGGSGGQRRILHQPRRAAARAARCRVGGGDARPAARSARALLRRRQHVLDRRRAAAADGATARGSRARDRTRTTSPPSMSRSPAAARSTIAIEPGRLAS